MFSGKLAMRYIRSNKRQSILTACSITIAVTVMITLFTMFSTVWNCLRNVKYNSTPFHVYFDLEFETNEDFELTEEYEQMVSAIKEEFRPYGTVNIIPSNYTHGFTDKHYLNPRFGLYFIKPIEGEYIDVIKPIFEKLGIDESFDTTDLGVFDLISNSDRAKWVFVILVFYVLVLFIAVALRLLIDTAFEISSKERERQFGILQSVGATPKQIVQIITFEGMFLSVIGIPLGVLLGIGTAYAAFKLILGSGIGEAFFSAEKAKELLKFNINPLFIILGTVTSIVWIFLSAYGVGMRVIKKAPVEVISRRVNTISKVGKHSLFGKLFGWTGKLAARNNMRQPKRFIISIVSLTVSISLFAAVSTAINLTEDSYYKWLEEYKPLSEFNCMTMFLNKDDIPDSEKPVFSYKEGIKAIRESGLFKEPMLIIDNIIHCKDDNAENGNKFYYLYYFNKEMYMKYFNGDPPVSYEELSKLNSYVKTDSAPDDPKPDSITCTIVDYVYANSLDEIRPEYRDAFEENKESVNVDGNDIDVVTYSYLNTQEITLNIAAYTDFKGQFQMPNCFIGTIDSYENSEYSFESIHKMLYGSDTTAGIYCDLKNSGDYENALQFFSNYKSNNTVFRSYTDNLQPTYQVNSLIASARIGTNVLNILFALIAVINMVNILSTGIIDRRGEIAALRSVGMTDRQLNKMTIIECLQYVLVSGAASIVLCELLMFLTQRLIGLDNTFGEMVGSFGIYYAAPLPRVLLALIPAFTAALLASFIPLYRLRKQSIIEQIRDSE